MSPAEDAARRAWEAYVVEARKRAKMEGDPNFGPADKVAQQRRADAAFQAFREAFVAIDAVPAGTIVAAPGVVRRLLAAAASLPFLRRRQPPAGDARKDRP